MKKVSLVNREVYCKTLTNGLEVLLFPSHDLDDYYISYFTKYGGVDLSFYDKDGKLLNTNPGIAHFLEHKLFESEGPGPFEFFAQSGSDVNAYTDYRQTAYILSGNRDFLKNLDYVLDYVNTINLTEENVEKEKGIIAEELKMYEDMPEWQIDEAQTKMIFSKSNMLHDVGGKVSDIMKITKDELTKCYEIFYQPSNMKLIISGNIDVDDTFKLIENHQKSNSKVNNFEIKRVDPVEPLPVAEKEKSITIKDIQNPRMYYVFKFDGLDNSHKNNMIARMFNNCLFGRSSAFVEDEEGKSFTYFYSGTTYASGYYLFELVANPKDIKSFIDKANRVIKETVIDEEMLSRAKKIEKSLTLRTYETNEALCRVLSYELIDNELLLDPLSLIDSITLEDLEDFRNKINLDNYSLLKVNY